MRGYRGRADSRNAMAKRDPSSPPDTRFVLTTGASVSIGDSLESPTSVVSRLFILIINLGDFLSQSKRSKTILISLFTMASPDASVSACRFSTRISIRWLPESAHETTDTIVMSVGEWYLDLRMEKSTGKIDWAIAGQRLIESQDPRSSIQAPRSLEVL